MVSWNWVSVQKICRILSWQDFDLMKNMSQQWKTQLSQIQNWGWSSCEDKCRWKKQFGQPFPQNWSLLELKFNSWFNNSCGTTTISTRLKSSRIEVQLKVQQLLWHHNQIHEILSLLQLQVQLEVQQLLWHHNQIHEIEVFYDCKFNSTFNNYWDQLQSTLGCGWRTNIFSLWFVLLSMYSHSSSCWQRLLSRS
jgi:hypothetical protein